MAVLGGTGVRCAFGVRGGAFCEPAKRQAGMQAGGLEHDAASMAMGARLRERGEDSMVTNIFGN